MKSGMLAISIASVVVACAPKLTDRPAGEFLVDRAWKAAADCAYNDLVTVQRNSPAQVTYTKLDAETKAILGVTDVNGEGAIVIQYVADGDARSRATTWGQWTAPGMQSYADRARVTVENCGGRALN